MRDATYAAAVTAGALPLHACAAWSMIKQLAHARRATACATAVVATAAISRLVRAVAWAFCLSATCDPAVTGV